MKGSMPGMVAIMLRENLPYLFQHEPQLGLKLLRLMGKSAMSKQLDNLRREGTKNLRAGISFQEAFTQTRAGQEGVELFMERLMKDGFDEDEAHQVASIASIATFKDGQGFLEAGQQFPFVIIVLSGDLNIELEVGHFSSSVPLLSNMRPTHP
jgi:hypothetical protein